MVYLKNSTIDRSLIDSHAPRPPIKRTGLQPVPLSTLPIGTRIAVLACYRAGQTLTFSFAKNKRGYFSDDFGLAFKSGAQFVTILCQSRLFSPLQRGSGQPDRITGNHPLSIEAIFPTIQSVIFVGMLRLGNHPLSIEAIFPTSLNAVVYTTSFW